MKTFAIIIGAFAMINSARAGNIEITRTSFVAASASNNSTVILNWVARNEAVNVRYEIERSFYNNNFSTVTAFEAAAGGATVKNYSISDNAAELAGRSVACYRVKQISANGTITYSNTIVVMLNNNHAAVTGTTTINFKSSNSASAAISIKNITGATVNTFNSLVNIGNNVLALDNKLAKGIYIIEVTVKGTVVDTQKVIVD